MSTFRQIWCVDKRHAASELRKSGFKKQEGGFYLSKDGKTKATISGSYQFYTNIPMRDAFINLEPVEW